MRNLGIAAMAAAMLATLGVAQSSAHTANYDTKLTMKVRSQVMKRGTFNYPGRIISDRQQCEAGRVVTLYRKEDGQPAVESGTAESNGQGKYSIINEVNPSIKYYTRVDKTIIGGSGHSHTCGADKSNVIDYSIPET